MLTDALLTVSNAQAVTSTAFSTNTIDGGAQPRDLGHGGPLYALISVDETAAAAGAATVAFQVVASANANLSSPTVLCQTDALAKTELTAGRRPIFLKVAPNALNALPFGYRYLGMQYVVTTGPLTAGKFTTTFVDHDAAAKIYPAQFMAA